MTAKNWIGLTIWLVFLLLASNIVLADAIVLPGDQIERNLGVCRRPTAHRLAVDDGGAVKLPYVGQVKIAGSTSGVAQVPIGNGFKR
jgi:protein involved in polysaccharide export with SLBB domain